MKNSGQIFLFIVFFTAGMTATVRAQDQPENQGELQPVEIEIVKERQITVPKASRHFEKIPPRPFEPVEPKISYELKVLDVSTPLSSPALRPQRLKQEQPENLYGGYFSGGYGSYITPFFDLYLNTKRDESRSLGGHAFFRNSGTGPVDDKNSAEGNYGLSLFGTGYTAALSTGLNIDFENRSTHFYGYPEGSQSDPDLIRQSVNLFSLGGHLASARVEALDYELDGSFNFAEDHYAARETELDLHANGGYAFADNSKFVLDGTYVLSSRRDAGALIRARHLLSVYPSYVFDHGDGLRIQAGLGVALENDPIDKSAFHFYPNVRVSYPLTDGVKVSGALTGGMEKVNYHSLVDENLWLAPNVDLAHTNRMFDLSGKIDARAGGKFLASAGFSLQGLRNMYCYVNDPFDVSKFMVLYDSGLTKRTNVFAALAFAYGRVVEVNLRGDLYGYATDVLEEAWHRPDYEISGYMRYNIYRKIILALDGELWGGVKAQDPISGMAIDLDPALAVGFSTTYRFSDKFSAFLKFRNMAGKEYPIFLNYPSRGFQVEGGISLSF